MLLLFMVCVSAECLAEVKCLMGETPDQCWTRAMPAADQEQALQAEKVELEAQTISDLHAKPTGIQTTGSNLKSNTTDFLPLIAMSGLLGDTKDIGTNGTYAFDLNFLIPGLAQDKNSKLKAVVNSQPKVATAIKQQIPEAQRDDAVKKIEAGLGDLADYSLSYTFDWIDQSHGRGFNNYENRFAALNEAIARRFQSMPVNSVKLAAIGEFGESLRLKHPDLQIVDNTTFGDILRQVGSDDFGVSLEKFETAAIRTAEALTVKRQMFTDAGLESFASLIDNQPQLTLSAVKKVRDKVAGGDETSGKLTYEWSRVNLNNALRGRCQQDLDTPSTDKIDDDTLNRCLEQYTSYVTQNAKLLKDGDKFSFSAEYLNIGKEVFDLPSQGLTGLKIDAAKKLIISAGWSRLFADPAGGDQPMRVDFVGSYENVSNDPQRQDRGVATLTITRKFGNLTVPLGIVYANHGEFLGDVNKQLSAHVGLKFDLGGLETPKGQ